MALVDAFLPEFDREMTTTRKLLERVPDDKFDWKPHPKSMTLGSLAQHVATIPMWGSVTMLQPEIDLGGAAPAPVTSRAELLKMFDKNVADARPCLAKITDEELRVTWTLKAAGNPVEVKPRYMMYRTMVINHLVHHRAQLGFYLRLTDQKVPPMYGPTADDKEAQKK